MRSSTFALAFVALVGGCGGNSNGHSDASGDGRDGNGNGDGSGMPDRGTVLECGGTIRNLSSHQGDILFVVDRSGSMSENVAHDGMSKWVEMQNALQTVLPTIEARIAMGLEFFPALGSGGGVNSCSTAAIVNSDIMLNNAHAMNRLLMMNSPDGRTPTAAALTAATSYFAAVPDPNGQHYIVLATDGAPNCNAALNEATCTCSSTTANDCRNPPADGSNLCLDDQRTIAAITALASHGIKTFVIGLPGTDAFGPVLDAMAVAGQEPQTGATKYFNATSLDALTAAFSAITSGIVNCDFHLDSAPMDPNYVDVRLNGVSLHRDMTHTMGWDWKPDGMFQDVIFYGATCTQVEDPSGGQQLVAAFGCPPPG